MGYGLGIADSLRAEGAPEPVGCTNFDAKEENNGRIARSDYRPDKE
jgi:hypothetical protein